jgi:hypothetical protein|tara:strand:- start:317 stop:556 length:240 start_codon:yes stop_codon:yes gene_type:complete
METLRPDDGYWSKTDSSFGFAKHIPRRILDLDDAREVSANLKYATTGDTHAKIRISVDEKLVNVRRTVTGRGRNSGQVP